MNQHRDGKDYKCETCGKLYNSKGHLKTHIRTVHNKEAKFNCTICDKGFFDISRLNLHIKRHIGEKDWKCKTCGNAYVTEAELSSHKDRVHGNKNLSCTICNKKFSSFGFKMHMKIHANQGRHKCDICGKTFPENHSLVQHMTTHTGERAFKCKICTKSFGTQGTLIRHVKWVHLKDKSSFKSCLMCSRKCATKTALEIHMRTHTGERPFRCKCGKDFTQLASLRSHEKSHLGIKPHKCEICARMFVHRGSLVDHMRSHTGEKPFKCKICGRQYSRQSYLKEHVRMQHSTIQKVPCGVCAKLFKTSSNLKKHQRRCPPKEVEDGGKFYCTFCSDKKNFMSEVELFDHLRLHVEEYPFECSTCGMQSVSEKTLVTHKAFCTED